MEKKKGWRPTLRALKSIRQRVARRKRIYMILDNLNHHKGRDIREWAKENNVELLFTPTYASWANPIECHLGAIPSSCSRTATIRAIVHSPFAFMPT